MPSSRRPRPAPPPASRRSPRRPARTTRPTTLPSTISSSTVVNAEKVQHRRRSLSRSRAVAEQAEENTAPPDATSPAKKRAKKTGRVLEFSPPDHAENARVQAERMAALEAERQGRIAQARARGQLLEFSPRSGRPLTELPMEQEMKQSASLPPPDPSPSCRPKPEGSHPQDDEEAKAEEETGKVQPPATVETQQQQELLQAELASVRQGVHQLLQQQNEASVGSNNNQNQEQLVTVVQQLVQNLQEQAQRSPEPDPATEQALAAAVAQKEQLELAAQSLQTQVQELQQQLSTEQQEARVTQVRLTTELEATQRVTSSSQERQQELQRRVDALQQQEHEWVQAKVALEQELAQLQQRLQEVETALQQAREQSNEKVTAVTQQCQEWQDLNQKLQQQVDSSDTTCQTLEQELDECRSSLVESQGKFESTLEELKTHQDESQRLAQQLDEYKSQAEKLESQVKALNQERLEERDAFQQLNQESGTALQNWKAQADEKQKAMDQLAEDLAKVQDALKTQQEAATQAEAEWKATQEGVTARCHGLVSELEETQAKLTQSVEDHSLLQQQLADTEQELQRLQESRSEIQSQQTETSTALTRLEERLELERQERSREAREKQEQVRHLERHVQLAEQERDEARHNMAGFDDREQELYRQLRESDRIRCELHSRVMQLLGNIRVYVRVRPPLPGELEQQQAARPEAAAVRGGSSKKRKRQDEPTNESLFHFPGVYDDRSEVKATSAGYSQGGGADDLSKNIIEVREPYKDRGGLSDRRKQWRFGFDNVFSPIHGQDDVWEATEPMVQCTVDGFNVTLFAYGQTGSGKTYTMLGEHGNEGIIGRSVVKLFNAKADIEALSKGETTVKLSVELLEVYNEQVRDLLAPNSGPNGREIPLKVTSKEVVGNIVVDTETQEDVMKVLSLAQKRRCVKATSSNAESSRSHMLFTIHFHVTMKNGMQRSGKLNVCDLAGSERLGKSGAHVVGGALLKETQHINKSLSCLSNVIERLQAGDANVPFRESKLTFLLQNSLGGNSKTLAIVCCSPTENHFHESLCSLRFASKVNRVDLKASANFSC